MTSVNKGIAALEAKKAAKKNKGAAAHAPAPAPSAHPSNRLGLIGLPKVSNPSAKTKFAATLASLKIDPKSMLKQDYIEPSFSSGSIVLDWVLGLGAIYRRGRIYSFHGPMHTGKSTMCYQTAAAWQHASGETVVIFDTEGQVDLAYLQACGLDPDLTVVFQAVTVTEIIRIATTLMDAGDCHCFILDSIARLQGQDVDLKLAKSGKLPVPQPGQLARTVGFLLNTLQPLALKSESVLLIVNQESGIIPLTQEDQNAAKYPTISKPNYTLKGGKAASYHPTVMIQTASVKAKDGTAVTGEDEWLFPLVDKEKFAARHYEYNETKIKVLKNKASAGGYREYHMFARPGQGFDDWISVRELARRYKLIDYIGSQWVVGNPQAPIATYKTKKEAVKDLVYVENMDVLVPLRVLVIEAIKAEDPRNFAYEPTAEEKYIAGESDVPPPPRVDFEDETPGTTDIDLDD